MTDRDLWDTSPRPAIERLARIEGQSNFLSMLQGIEVGPDTTEDMGALSFARMRGCVPETLEAQVAQSTLFKLPLMAMVYQAVVSEFSPPEKDLPWVRGAIADAFLLLSRGKCQVLHVRAKGFSVRLADYAAMRKVAHGVFLEMVDRALREWTRARKRESAAPVIRHSVGVDRPNKSFGVDHADSMPATNQYGMADGCYFATPLPTDADGETPGFDIRGLGIFDRLGWDERNTKAGPVLTLYGAEAEGYIKQHPSQPHLT